MHKAESFVFLDCILHIVWAGVQPTCGYKPEIPFYRDIREWISTKSLCFVSNAAVFMTRYLIRLVLTQCLLSIIQFLWGGCDASDVETLQTSCTLFLSQYLSWPSRCCLLKFNRKQMLCFRNLSTICTYEITWSILDYFTGHSLGRSVGAIYSRNEDNEIRLKLDNLRHYPESHISDIKDYEKMYSGEWCTQTYYLYKTT